LLSLAILGTRGIPARYGGFETFAEQLAIRLVARGIQVTVYAEADEVGLPDSWHQGVRVRHIHRPSWGPASVIGYDCRCLWDAHGQHDIVYMLGYGAAWACWLSRLRGQRVWLNVDGLEWARSKWNWVARTYLRLMEWVSSWAPSRIIADAQAIADHFQAQYPRAVACTFIAYGADQGGAADDHAVLRDTWGLTSGGYALVVARPEPENHVLEIVRAYLQANRREPLVVVGGVAPVNAYQRRLLALAGGNVRFLGGVYDDRLLKQLRLHAACYLHGHSVGGTNPSLLEALACGNVTIAHDNPFNREVGGDAMLYFGSESELIQHLHQAMDMPSSDRRQWAQRAKHLIASRYSWDDIATAYERLMGEDLRHAASH
jgi:glycosyltransferase involved in cell wall biosynthesis